MGSVCFGSPSQLANYCFCSAGDDASSCSLSRASDPACKRCVRGIAMGNYHLCVMLFDGSLECAGYNRNGQLWNGLTEDFMDLVAASALAGLDITSVGNGWSHGCVLTAASEGGNRVLCVGDGKDGELGDGELSTSMVPVTVQGLQPSRIVQLAVGGDISCVVYADPDSLVQCWGDFRQHPTLGDVSDVYAVAITIPGTTGARALAVGTSAACAVLKNFTVVCWEPSSYFREYVTAELVEGLQNVGRIAAGGFYGCAIVPGSGLAEDAVWCWNLIPSAVSDVITSTNIRNTPRRVVGLPPGTVVDVVAGSNHACVLVKGTAALGGDVYCWGFNDYGQLGQGYVNATSGTDGVFNATTGTSTPLRVKGLSDVTALYGGSAATCAVTASQQVMCWGDNGYGMLAISGRMFEGVAEPAAMQGVCA